jgi:transcriptional regulator with XRE-family HTH domain
MGELGRRLREARKSKGWSLRDVEAETEVRNAHLSQIETGTIEKPDPNVLWTLARAYGIEKDYNDLLVLAGHISAPATSSSNGGGAAALALRSLVDLTPEQQLEVVGYINRLKEQRPEQA